MVRCLRVHMITCIGGLALRTVLLSLLPPTLDAVLCAPEGAEGHGRPQCPAARVCRSLSRCYTLWMGFLEDFVPRSPYSYDLRAPASVLRVWAAAK